MGASLSSFTPFSSTTNGNTSTTTTTTPSAATTIDQTPKKRGPGRPRKNKKAADNKNKTSFVNLVGLQSVNRRRFTSQHGQRLRHHHRRNIH